MRLTEEQYAGLLKRNATLKCARCGGECARRGAMQKYCTPCSEICDLARKAKWASENPLPRAAANAKSAKERVRSKAKGKVLSVAAKSDIAWTADPQLEWLVRVAMPFDWGFSKNAIYRMGLKGHVTLREEVKSLREVLALKIKQALGERVPVQGKVWLDIMVQKPNHKGDAVNVIDTVCDSIKKVIGVDDRWYSIRRLDWEIVKENPQIFIGIGQEITVAQYVCAQCGRQLPREHFWGIKKPGRECRDCRTVAAA